jgi:hypothetical protein
MATRRSRKASPRTSKAGRVQAPPPLALKAAEELRQRPGVVCVVWGQRRTGTKWFREPCLSVHVAKKKKRLAPNQVFPRELHGFRVDVLEVGAPKPHFSVRDRVTGALGASTATVLAAHGASVLALTSGHGTLRAGQLELDSFVGTVLGGGFGESRSVDWALAKFPGAAGQLESVHPATGTEAPLRLAADLPLGQKVRHFSRKRGAIITGVLQGTVLGEVTLGDDTYTSLVSIVSGASGEPFSVPGDSGSLVVDEDGLAVGAIVGGKAPLHVFYAYDLSRLEGSLSPARFSLFFEGP